MVMAVLALWPPHARAPRPETPRGLDGTRPKLEESLSARTAAAARPPMPAVELADPPRAAAPVDLPRRPPSPPAAATLKPPPVAAPAATAPATEPIVKPPTPVV